MAERINSMCIKVQNEVLLNGNTVFGENVNQISKDALLDCTRLFEFSPLSDSKLHDLL